MREFMTKVSDYLSERRNDPERREDRLAIVIVGVAAAVVIVALLLVLWGQIAKGRGESGEDDDGALQATAYEEKMKEYLSQNDRQAALWREYLDKAEYLDGKVEELLAAMTQVEQSLSETILQYREGDDALRDELASVHTEVNAIVYDLRETQTKLYDLTDIVQLMNEETIPVIQGQIVQIQADIEQARGDIAGLYAKVAALEQEDVKLWESIGDVESILGDVENNLQSISVSTLRYRYDEGENTLYLEPYQQ